MPADKRSLKRRANSVEFSFKVSCGGPNTIMKTISQFAQVIQLGTPVLRKKAKIIKNIQDPEIKKLTNNLLKILMKVNGVGMAAPQLNKSLRLFIVASHPNPRYPKAPYMKPTAVINPKILSHNNEKKKDWEGCLSVPGVRALVPRYTEIKVEYTTKQGRKVRKIYKDFIARIFQHEYDHLEGLVFLDRIESTKDIISEKEYQKLMRKK